MGVLSHHRAGNAEKDEGLAHKRVGDDMKGGIADITHQRHIDADVDIDDHQHADDPQNLNGIHHRGVT